MAVPAKIAEPAQKGAPFCTKVHVRPKGASPIKGRSLRGAARRNASSPFDPSGRLGHAEAGNSGDPQRRFGLRNLAADGLCFFQPAGDGALDIPRRGLSSGPNVGHNMAQKNPAGGDPAGNQVLMLRQMGSSACR